MALRTGGQVVVADVAESQIFLGTPALEVMLDAGARAVQSTPLVGSSGLILGMISTHWHAPGLPNDQQLLRLDRLAQCAAAWVEQRMNL